MDTKQLITNFLDRRPIYERFTGKLESLLEELLKQKNIPYHLIEARTKSIESFSDKIIRKSGKYSDVIEITDLSALRIIVYYPSDITQIVNLIHEEFIVDPKNSKIIGQDLSPNEFGYLSSHLVFKLKENRTSLSEYKYFENLNCEIQIRTVLQHAWASISHALQYKTKLDIPTNLQRKLFRLAGLFELADEQFVEIRDIHNSLVTQIQNKTIKPEEQELNLLSVKNFVKTSPVVGKIYSLALKHGFTDSSETEMEFDHDEDETETISELIKLASLVEIKTIEQLDNFIKGFPDKELKTFFQVQISQDRISETAWYVTEAFIFVLLLIYAYPEKITVETLTSNGWFEPIAKRVIENSKKAKNK